MKRVLLFLLLLVCSKTIIAQDQLYKKDNSKLLVKIIEINSEEIKYKLYENLNGPVYTEPRNSVMLIIYENGKHEVFQSESAPVQPLQTLNAYALAKKKDSLSYYGYSNNISLNFLNFFNSEVGLIYQKEFFSSNFNFIIPVAVGLTVPYITQSVWYGEGTNVDLQKKRFEVGLGLNYYPSLESSFNYFIGPVFRFMQFDCIQTYHPGTYNNPVTTKYNTLNRYSMTITNGFVFRTKSRLTSTLFLSLGFKNDQIIDPILDPVTNKPVPAISNPVTLTAWLGFNVGFNF